MTTPAPAHDATRPTAAKPGRAVEVWKWIVIVLGVLLVAAFITLISRVVYLAFNSPTQARPGATMPEMALALPAGATVRSISLSGDRLAIHYSGSGGDAIAHVDLTNGRILSRIRIVPER